LLLRWEGPQAAVVACAPSVPETFAVEFPGRSVAMAVRVDAEDELPDAVAALGLRPRPTLVLVGGAGGLSGDDSDALKSLFVETVAPLVGELGAQVVDGATDAGVMRLLGRARHDLGLDFPLIGVAARENVAMPGAPAQGDAAPLEPNHSHFVLVAGSGWGSESPWIARFAATLAGEERSATLLVHGGDIAWTDAAESVADERTVVTVVGSGGTADALAAKADPRARPLTSSGLVVAAEDGALAPLLRELLGGTA
jgi:SLOG in TRPM, prokaryote